ncbi:pentapeptide repeat-containing protein [Nostoc piscinale CENA21]|uniref:Pentapeptide repeat-containing protein n=1 Tax=Nostoc piscinale CENA21 TaxID=224013 RepID=A0A0M4T1V1_9NOSO|nr:pentapeptide repeat-containing protein [Nostoc piscinale]ALF53282.1 pentapeptide repeat-containing protein [Nostoc piscinale CENA21]
MNLSIRQWLAERQIEISQIREFSLGQLAGVAYRIVQDMEVKSLAPLDVCTLAEVLELPLGSVWQDINLIARLTESLLRSLSEKKALKRNEGTWLAFQIAYLYALHQIIQQEVNLQKPWLNRAMISSQGEILQEIIGKLSLQDVQLQGLLKTLTQGKLTDTQAEQALSIVADSLLVQQMNNATVAWLIANGAEDLEAKLLTQRLTHSLSGYLLKVVAENAPQLAQLQKFFQLGSTSNIYPPELGNVDTSQKSSVGEKIDLCRENYRVFLLQNLSQTLFIESFALKDIYIPLKGLVANTHTPSVDIKKWAQEQLADSENIAVITAEPGYGKTSFCQIWAAEVARELYPNWMPVVIRLRDIKYAQTLAETLNYGFALNAQTNLSNWLEQEHLRCLLLLDGLDELPAANLGTRSKTIFIQQLIALQAKGKHKIILTTRKNALEEIDPDILSQLPQIIIQPLEQEQLKQWFQQWAMLQSLPIAQNFFTFLKQSGLFVSNSKFPELSALVRQPLLLYLLGVLHRDALIDDEIWQLAQSPSTTKVAWEIYHRLSRWLLGYPVTGGIKTMLLRSGSAHIHRTQEAIANLLSGCHPQDLLNQIQAIALQILHSDRYQIHLTETSLPHTLPAFYFKTSPSALSEKLRAERTCVRGFPSLSKVRRVSPVEQTSVTQHSAPNTQHSTLLTEFSHPKLGEYLCAEAIAHQLKILTQQQKDDYGTLVFALDSPQSVAQNLYKLLGYGVLTTEIKQLVIETLLHQSQSDFSLDFLLQRLELFWRGYCQGRWLNEGIAHQAWNYFHTLGNPINVEQINASVGINVFLLLSAGYRVTKVAFSPCGNPQNVAEFYPEVLTMLMGKAAILSNSVWLKRILPQSLTKLNLSSASLLQVMLVKANLEQTNLSSANLSYANLTNANLSYANLTNANLSYANLTNANLSYANLTSANMTGANLSSINLENVNLANACLFDAILTDADREIATMNGAVFSLEQFYTLKKLLSQSSVASVIESDDQTAAWLSNTNIGTISGLEGEPVASIDLYDDVEDETVFSVNPSDYD